MAPVALFSLPVFENKDKIVIVMEYASRGDLYDYICDKRNISEREARHFFRQIVSAVHYCHQVSIKLALTPRSQEVQPCVCHVRPEQTVRSDRRLFFVFFSGYWHPHNYIMGFVHPLALNGGVNSWCVVS